MPRIHLREVVEDDGLERPGAEPDQRDADEQEGEPARRRDHHAAEKETVAAVMTRSRPNRSESAPEGNCISA